MELKEFIKGVLRDVTDAVSESQKELSNGAVVSPMDTNNDLKAYVMKGDKYRTVSDIDFDIAVTVSAESDKGGNIGGSIRVLSASLGGKVAVTNEEVSRVKFSIPIVFNSQTL